MPVKERVGIPADAASPKESRRLPTRTMLSVGGVGCGGV